MSEPEFLLTFPLYIVIIDDDESGPLVCIAESDENVRGVALFTEELFAERVRDSQAVEGKVCVVESMGMLKKNLASFKASGHKYFAIDPDEKTCGGWYLAIEDLEG